MAKPEFLQRLGVFVVREFIDPDRCAKLCAEVEAASHEKATVGHQVTAKGTGIVDENVRKVLRAELPDNIQEFLYSRLDALKPDLERHFRMELSGYSGPHFLRYQPGGFYTAHTDRSPGAPPSIAARRVSVVIFLNSPSKEPVPGSYGGGALRFHRLLNGPQWENCALSLDAETGLLVAFDSTVLHEVLPVTFGERMTIVAWFIGP